MRISDETNGWHTIHEATQPVRAYLRHTVPTSHRRYESEPVPHWVVHSKYLDGVKQLGGVVEMNPYATLYLTKGAPPFMIEAAWKALAKHHHPDHNGDAEDFRRCKEAYEVLKNERDDDRDSS